jgi:NAD(P)-dependent dehydrogenase (short-subunit alcohol dehydrogenase family)
MDLGLAGKTAVVTGGTRGIGYGVAEGLAAEGVQVALCSRDSSEADEAARRIGDKFGTPAIGLPVDVTKAEDIDGFTVSVEKDFGGVDILISNAGMGSEETIMDAPDEQWQYFWDLQVMAAVRLARAFVPSMKRRGGGVIINNAWSRLHWLCSVNACPMS